MYGQAVNILSHMTDVWRVDFMIKYGGIYVDTDVVFVRPLERDIRGYDAVGSYDWTYWNHPFPDTINFGVALGKRNAPFWHKFQVTCQLSSPRRSHSFDCLNLFAATSSLDDVKELETRQVTALSLGGSDGSSEN